MATEITYVPFPVGEAVRNEPKLAKIGQDKLTNVRNNYKKELAKLVQKTEVKVEPVMEEAVKPMDSEVTDTPVETTLPKANNYEDVLKKFSMEVYKTSPVSLKVVSARKIRVNPNINKQAMGLRDECGHDVLFTESVKEEAIVPEVTTVLEEVVTPLVEPIKPEEPEIVEDKVIDIATKIPSAGTSPSVDDYLQKEVPNADNGLITELSTDINKLKEEALRRKEILDQLEAQYTDLKNQKARRIKELEEEKLSYTATLEGLTDKIKNLQSAIAKERQTLGDNEEVGRSLAV